MIIDSCLLPYSCAEKVCRVCGFLKKSHYYNNMASRLRIVPILLARLSSSRLPAKCLLEMRPGISILNFIVLQLQGIPQLEKPILATSTSVDDDLLEEFARALGLQVYRGSLENVFERFCMAAKIFEADFALRVNCDSPIIDKGLIKEGINVIISDQNNTLKYITNLCPRSYPYGISLQLIKTEFLEKCLAKTLTLDEMEHITPAIDGRLSQDYIYNITCPFQENFREKHLAVDTLEDYKRISMISSRVNFFDKDFIWWKSDIILSFLRDKI